MTTTSSHQISGGRDRYTPALGAAFRDSLERGNGEAPDGNDAGGDKPRLPSLDMEAPAEPVFSEDSWLDEQSQGEGSLADHPLLRGLLLELPPKGTTPPPGWLDRWFEATRSILELLYVTDKR